MIANAATGTIEKQNPKAAAKKARKLVSKPPLTPDRIYTSAEAALAIGVSTITLIRARNAGRLAELRAGRKVLHSGKQLLDWLEAGGRTSAEK